MNSCRQQDQEQPLVQTQVPNSASQRPARAWPRRAAAFVALAIIVAFILSPPWSVLDKADVIGYATCHRIPNRSFHLGGRQLPLCARCTGTYLGVLAGLGIVWLRGRRRTVGFPPVRVLAAFVGFWAIWGVDGLNSYLALLGAPHLYEPHHLLRVMTGSLNGLVLSGLVWPVFNFSLWKGTDPQPAVRNLRELGAMVVLAWAAGLIVYAEPPALLYPVALVSALCSLLMLTLVNTVLVLVITRQEAVALTWRDAVMPMTLGLALALVEVGIIDYVRFKLLPPLPF
jgi:uncharacterized membrane protein